MAERSHVIVEAVCPNLVRLIIPSWQPHIPLYVARNALPLDMDANLLVLGRLSVRADLEAGTMAQIVDSFDGWELA
jgi:hypothetical protein